MKTSATLLLAFFCLGITPASATGYEPDVCTHSVGNPPVMEADVTGGGRPLVMLGGGLLGAANWREHAERLSDSLRVIRLQNLNVKYGLEGRPIPPQYSIRMESCALKRALDSLGLAGPVDVVGLSLGALTALDFALNYPERIRTLTLVEPPAAWVLDPVERASAEVQEWERVMAALRKRELSEQDLFAFTCAVQGCAGGATLEQAMQMPGWDTRAKHRQSLRGVYAVAEHGDDVKRLRSFNRPVLFVEGAGTGPVHVLINSAFKRHLPRARYLELPGGHGVSQVSMDRFLEELTTFMVRVN